MVVLGVIVGFALGALAVLLWTRSELARREASLAQERASAEERLAFERAAAAERLALVERTHEDWEKHVKAATSDAMSRSTSSLLELADAKLKPIKETLERFDESWA